MSSVKMNPVRHTYPLGHDHLIVDALGSTSEARLSSSYVIVSCEQESSGERFQAVVDLSEARSGGVHGMVFWNCPPDLVREHAAECEEQGLPCISAGVTVRSSWCPSVATCQASALRIAVNYLMDRGHGRVALLVAPDQDDDQVEAWRRMKMNLSAGTWESCVGEVLVCRPESWESPLQVLAGQLDVACGFGGSSAVVATTRRSALLAREALHSIGRYWVPVVCLEDPGEGVDMPSVHVPAQVLLGYALAVLSGEYGDISELLLEPELVVKEYVE